MATNAERTTQNECLLAEATSEFHKLSDELDTLRGRKETRESQQEMAAKQVEAQRLRNLIDEYNGRLRILKE